MSELALAVADDSPHLHLAFHVLQCLIDHLDAKVWVVTLEILEHHGQQRNTAKFDLPHSGERVVQQCVDLWTGG